MNIAYGDKSMNEAVLVHHEYTKMRSVMMADCSETSLTFRLFTFSRRVSKRRGGEVDEVLAGNYVLFLLTLCTNIQYTYFLIMPHIYYGSEHKLILTKL